MNNGCTYPPRNSAAFTLVECLIVIGLTAALCAAVFPLMGTVRRTAQQTACASNMRQIGSAIALYAAENRGNFPESSHSVGINFHRAWIYSLAPYLQNMDEVRICPADPKGEERLENHGTSYTLNSFITLAGKVDAWGQITGPVHNNLWRLQQPTRTIVMFNISDSKGVDTTADHTHGHLWKRWENVCADIQPDRFINGRPQPDRSRGSANYLFADGHVENLKAGEIKALFERGVNFAEVPE